MEKGDEAREAFLRRAAAWYDAMAAGAGPESGDVFDDIEEQAEEMGREATRELLRARLAAEEAAQPEETPCPKCGGAMRRPSKGGARNLETASGCVSYERRHAICDRCRASFSPSGPPVENPPPGPVEPPPA